MAANTTNTEFSAEFFDGQTAASRAVIFKIAPDHFQVFEQTADLVIKGSYSGLELASPRQAGQPLRVKHSSLPAARILIHNSVAIADLLTLAPQLDGKVRPKRVLKTIGVIAAGFACLALFGYLLLTVAPGLVARQIPETWRDRLGEHVETSVIKSNKACSNAAGRTALNQLVRAVTGDQFDDLKLRVKVVDLPMVNAFAVPGGRIVMTGKLISKASGPDEVAGVFAHELGHVVLHHPEAAFVRIMGLQLILSLASGGTGPELIGNVASLMAVLSYSREAETQADLFAVKQLRRQGIGTKGFRAFFARIMKKDRSLLGGSLGGMGDILSTHPGTEERIEAIDPSKDGKTRSILTTKQWRDLKNICK